jgi:hypothetical protein
MNFARGLVSRFIYLNALTNSGGSSGKNEFTEKLAGMKGKVCAVA